MKLKSKNINKIAVNFTYLEILLLFKEVSSNFKNLFVYSTLKTLLKSVLLFSSNKLYNF